MVIEVFKSKVVPFKDGSYFQYFEEKEPDWIKYPEIFIELKDELDKHNKNFSATFNLKDGQTKKISILEINRFVDGVDSGKIVNKTIATDRYLKYIYDDKDFLDDRNIVKKIKGRKGEDKGKKNF